MRTILILNILFVLMACSGPDSIPPDKNATHIADQPDNTPSTEPKIFLDLQAALNNIDSVKAFALFRPNSNKFPLDICKLVNLEELDLTGCDLDSIPELIGELKNLKRLDLRNNKLTTLPKRLFELTKLEQLDNFGNKINNLSPDIKNLTNLRELNISFNDLKTLPDLTGLDKLHNLSCDGNFLTAIPQSICSLKKLYRLSFLRNKITTVNNCISELKYLNNFVLTENFLSSEEIEKVKALLPDRGVYTDMQN
jgi:Leucine-rich repeat (LRR) protein